MRVPRFAFQYCHLLFAAAVCVSCTDQRNVRLDAAVARPALKDLPSLPPESVGSEISKYSVRMDRIRLWYTVIRDVTELAKTDSTVGVKMNYSISAPLLPLVEHIESVPAMRAELATVGMSAQEFVVLTTVMGAGWGAVKLVDSLGSGAAPVNFGPELLAFMRAHKTELDSLERTIHK